jgi:hypothetical protein
MAEVDPAIHLCREGDGCASAQASKAAPLFRTAMPAHDELMLND